MIKKLKILLGIIVTLFTLGATFVYAAPSYTFQKSILPEANNQYYLGSTSPSLQWNGIFTKDLTVTGTCTGCGGSGGGGVSATTTTIVQANHGFTAGQWVGLATSTYALTNAIPGGVYQGVGYVKSVTDSNTFVLQTGGDFTDTNLIPGMSYFLSASTTALGTIVGYPPTTVGYISAPVAFGKSQTTGTIQVGRPSIVALSSSSFGMNVGNDQIGSTYYASSSNVADAAILVKNLANKQVRIALPSYNNPVGVYNMRELAKYYKSLGFSVSYGVTGLSGIQNSTTYAAWLAQVPTEAAWASANGINRFYIGNEEDWQAQISQFGTITGDQVRNDVRSLSTTLKNAYPSMEIVYSTAEGTVAQWGALYPDFGALDHLGFNMYNTLSGFDAGVAYFQSQIGSKFFASEWAANYPYYDMVHSHGETDSQYAADLASRQQTLTSRGVEAYFFALRYGDNTLASGNWNILLDNNTFNPGAYAAFGGAGNAVKTTPLILLDNQKFYLNTVKTGWIDADSTDVRLTAPEFGNFKVSGRLVITSAQSPQLSVKYDSSNYFTSNVSSVGTTTFSAVGTNPSFTFVGGPTYVSSIFATTSATSTIANLAGVYDATACSGSDIGAKVNDCYTRSSFKNVTIKIPNGSYTYSTPIACATNGKRCTIVGDPAGGTNLFYTGSGAAITINHGIQGTGIDHTSGCGVRDLTITGNSYSTTSPQIGLYVGGTNGSDCSTDVNVNLQHLGIGLQIGANAYHYNNYNSSIRDNGQNIHVNAASNSGEDINFHGLLMADMANHQIGDCIWFDNSATESTSFFGGQINDCDVHILQANNVSFFGTDWENVGSKSTGWPAYTYITIDNNSATNVNISGGVFFNTATTGYSPSTFISNGGTLNLTGNIVRRFNSDTVSQFVTLTGSGRVTWQSMNNVSNLAVSNITGSLGITLNGTTGSTTLAKTVITAPATTTANVGFDISTGCYAIDGTCITGSGGGSSASTTLLSDVNTFSGTNNNFSSNLGVGTSSPYAKLSVAGQVVAANYVATTTATSTFVGGIQTAALNVTSSTASSTFANGMNLASGCYAIAESCIGSGSFSNTLANGGTATTTFYNGGLIFSDGSKLTQAAVPQSLFWDDTNQRLGLGTSSPYSKLAVSGQVVAANFVGTTTATSSLAGALNIGIANGSFPLEVQKNVSGVLTNYFQNTNSSTAADVQLFLGTRGTSEDLTTGVSVYADRVDTNSQFGTTNLLLKTSAGNSLNTNMVITGFGLTGVGTTSPWGVLSVADNGSPLQTFNTTGYPLFVVASSTTISGGTKFIVASGGNVGVGTTTPGVLFSTNGAGLFNGALTSSNIITTSASATSTFGAAITVAAGQGTSTFASGLSATNLNLTGSSATNTASNGFNITAGCFSINDTCVGGSGGGGSGTVGSGTTGQFPYYAGSGTTLTATSSAFLASNSFLGFGTTSPLSKLHVYDDNDYTLALQRSTTTLANNLIRFANGVNPGLYSGYIGLRGNPTSTISTTARLEGESETCIGASCAGSWNTPIWSKMTQPGVTDPSTPSTATPAHLAPGDGDDNRIKIDLSTQSGVSVATTVTVHFYARGSIVGIYPSLWANGSQVGAQDDTAIPTGSYGWLTTTWTGLSLSQSDIDTLQIQLDAQLTDPPTGSQYIDIAQMYPVITYTGNVASSANLVFGTNPNPSVPSSLAERMRITDAGLVGIGTTSPYSTLSVVGQVVASNFVGTTTATSTLGGGLSTMRLLTTATSTMSGINLNGGCFAINGTCLSTGGGGSSASSTLLVDTNTFSGTNNNFTSNLGIGTSSPYAKLSVAGEIVGGWFTATSTTATSTVAGPMTVAGRFGIGTTNPGGALTIVSGSSDVPLLGSGAGSASNAAVNLAPTADSIVRWGQQLTTTSRDLWFVYRDSVSSSPKVSTTFTRSGLVGIGSTTPWATLSVNAFNQSSAIPTFAVATSSSALGTTTQFVITGAGNVGIATTTPGSLFSIGGIANFTTATSTFSGSGGVNLTNGCYAVNGVCVGAPPVYPQRCTLWADEANQTAGTGGYLGQGNAPLAVGYPYGTVNYGSGAVGNGDERAWSCVLAAGTYNLYSLTDKNSDNGIVDYSVNGSVVGTFDNYNVTEVKNTTAGGYAFTVSTPGRVLVKATINGKNASATNYYLYLTKVFIVPTTDTQSP